MALQLDEEAIYDLVMRFREQGAIQVTVEGVHVTFPAERYSAPTADAPKRAEDKPQAPNLRDAARSMGIGPISFPTRSE